MSELTLLVVNYNSSRWLQECFNSINGQTLPEFALVFVDDCSSDNSIQMFESFKWRNGISTEFVQTNVNSGVSVSRNLGASKVATDFITQIDSDDFFLVADKLEKELNLAKKMSGCIAFSAIQLVDDNSLPLASQGNAQIESGDIAAGIFRRDVMIPRDFTMPLELFHRAGGYDPKINLYEDWDLKLRLARVSEFHFSGVTGIAYRRHGAGLSSVDSTRHREAQARVLLKNFHSYSQKLGYDNVYKSLVDRGYCI